MNPQMLRNNTTTLRAFLNLILNARPKPKSGDQDPSRHWGYKRVSPEAVLPGGEATAATQPLHVRRRALGPFVSLVLRVAEQKAAERLRFAAEQNRPCQALCVRIHVG